ncbi:MULTISPECIES: non-heme iron oxygenase ferredoxin subunit [unclassified Janibacter]|uniref:non-heme iron oxygenase ferredoxin subunit n=1 Tax=unclassified Janibacter TaxID=2649294 RepID=UPI003D043D5F
MSETTSTQTAADRDEWVRVCRLDELPEVGAAKADINGRLVAIITTADGDIHAIDDTCTHANVSLSEGELDGCEIECWLHGSRFDITTGQPNALPATTPVAVHDVKVVDGEVHVALNN